MKRPEPHRAILLTRVSTEKEEQESSLERQLARLEAIAKARGWRVTTRIEEQHTGRTVLGRPGVARALDLVVRNKADVIVVDHIFRLGRNVREMLQVIETLNVHGGAFYDATTEIDTTGPLGRLIFTVYASIGEFVIADQRRKIIEGLNRARMRGTLLGRKRKLPVEVGERAFEIKREQPTLSWAVIRRQLEAEGLGLYSRGAISVAAWRLSQVPRSELVANPPESNERQGPDEPPLQSDV